MTDLRSEVFGTLAGQEVPAYLLQNTQGIRARVLPLGAIVQAIEVPDAHGRLANVVLGYANVEDYLHTSAYFGSVVGRYANRIAGGQFSIDGKQYQCLVNNGPNLLHGGPDGFNCRIWSIDHNDCERDRRITLRLISDDGDQGFPGRLAASVTYSLDDAGCFSILYEATTDRPTVINLSQHTYFNLAGESSGTALDHLLRLNASSFTPVDSDLIPTGDIADVAGTPFDFRVRKPIAQDIRHAHPQILAAGGYDHNFVIDRAGQQSSTLVEAASVVDPRTGRSLDVATTEPGVQFYSGNFLHGQDVGTGGCVYRQGDGFALETQHFPDSPNQPTFPSTGLQPGITYRSMTTWTFGWE
ncbi:MAG: aldose epimerase family protein [Thermomicrobiales bacterium]